ncbi:MAG: DUF1295 domain-containing protein [Chloroflexota bacterium]|nr:DUF1295 domain-containing protein [Chloroflexota bacterium]
MDDSKSKSKDKSRALALVTLAYIAALCVAVGIGYAAGDRHPALIAFVADVAATLTIYTFARCFRNASFYDAYWSVAPVAIGIFWLTGAAALYGDHIRQLVILFLVTFWGIRLTLNWARGWRGLKHEDWRYADMRAKHGRWFWLTELIGIEMMPTLVVFLSCLPLYPALAAGTNPFNWLDGVAIAVTAAAVLIESLADEQLRAFVQSDPQPGEIMNRGLWRYSRHPNYFGEVAFWWGLYLFGLAADPSYWWTIAGPLAMTLLFVFISIPMMDKRSLARRPEYAEHMKRVSAFVPWFNRK